MRTTIRPSSVQATHADYAILLEVELAIFQHLRGDAAALQVRLGQAIRTSIDNVIDTPKTGRRKVLDLEKTEKTYLGTRVEIELRALLEAKKGKLDLILAGRDVDVKFTIGNNWMIPTEALDHVCILVAADEDREKLFVGLIVIRSDYLTGGSNRDGKRSISASGMENIRWLVLGEPYPPNFWKSIPAGDVERIFAGRSGTERIATLFTLVQNSPIPRAVIADVAKQDDFMKRVRANGGARDVVSSQGIVILHGKSDAELIQRLGLSTCSGDEFISKELSDPSDKALARRYGHDLV